ncbi:MAG: hypothetical protein JSV03_07270, partial [Planctomycetota bacterium]
PMNDMATIRQVIQQYINEFKSKDIIIYIKEANNRKVVRCAVGPDFVTNGLNLWDEGSLVWLGFCYSGLGSWQEKFIVNAGASACLYWDAASYGVIDIALAREMYEDMCDTTRWTPVTVGFWYDNTEKSVKYFFEEGKTFNLLMRGTPNLTFWEEEETAQDVIDLGMYKWCLIELMVNASLNDSEQGSQEMTQTYFWSGTGSFSGRTFTSTWDTPGDPVLGFDASRGSIHVTVDETGWNVINFSATETEVTPEAYAGNHYTTIQTVHGSHVALTSPSPPLVYSFSGKDITEVVQSLEYRHEMKEYGSGQTSTIELTDYFCGANMNCYFRIKFSVN